MKKLLIVDDEEEIVDFLSEFFTGRGDFTVLTATSQEEAIEVVKKERPNLVLLDIRLRNKRGGFEVLAETKKISPSTKVIMVTAIQDHLSIEEALRLGADNYITKPLSLEYLEGDVVKKLKEVSGGV